MTVTIECPTCTRRVKVPEAAGGKKVKCPGCEGMMTVPVFEPEPETRSAPSRRKLFDEDDDIPRRRRSNVRDLEEDDDTPRRRRPRRDDDDDRDSNPNQNGRTLLLYGGGGLGAILLLIGILALCGVFKSKKGGGGTTKVGNAPPGWTTVDDDDFTAFMPGTPTRQVGLRGTHTHNGVVVSRPGDMPEGVSQQSVWTAATAGDQSHFTAFTRTYQNKTVGITEAFLLEEAGHTSWGTEGFVTNRGGFTSEIVSKTMTTHAGKPCLEVKFQAPDTFGALKPYRPVFEGDPNDPVFRRSHEEKKQRFLKERKQGVLRVVADGSRVFVLIIESTGGPPAENDMKTFFESLSLK